MRKWPKLVIGGLYVLALGLVGAAGTIIMNRRQMYGDDSKNDPYSPDWEPSKRR